MDFTGKFSFPYPSLSEEGYSYYYLLKNATQEYRDEISDVYFSDPFYSKDKLCTYGDVMGMHPPESHHEWILKIQNELNVPVSLTFNSMVIDHRLTAEYFEEFAGHIRKWYDAGVRSCTISNTHMMGTGILQKEFPEMIWKNTVNHIVGDSQTVLDYYKLGYNTILLDRSLNRNWDELKRIRKLQEKFPGIKTSLLVTEGCAPSCAFKKEHDDIQQIENFDYWSNHGAITCSRWRNGIYGELPRLGTDIVATTTKDLEEISNLVDIFKFSGRMGAIPNIMERANAQQTIRFGWGYYNRNEMNSRWNNSSIWVYDHMQTNTAVFETFREAYESDLEITLSYTLPAQILAEEKYDNKEYLDESIWRKNKKARGLAAKLKKCRNQCWDCNACEKVFGVEEFDSYIDIGREPIQVLPDDVSIIDIGGMGK